MSRFTKRLHSHKILPAFHASVVDGMEEIVGPLKHVIDVIDTYAQTARPETRSLFHQGIVTTLSEAKYATQLLKVVIRESAPQP